MQQKVFTLIDLMIVTVIVAILAGIAVPQYLAYNRRAEVAEMVGFEDLGGHFELAQGNEKPGFTGDTICGCCFCWRI